MIRPGDCNVYYGCSGPVCENNNTEAQWWWALSGLLIVGVGVVTFAQLSLLLIKTIQANKLDRRDATSQCLVCCMVGEFFSIIHWIDIMWRRPFTCTLGTTEIVDLFTQVIAAACLAMFGMLSCIALVLMWYDESQSLNVNATVTVACCLSRRTCRIGVYMSSKDMQSASTKDPKLERLKLFLQGFAIFFGTCHHDDKR